MDPAQIIDRVVARFIGTKHERDVKKLQPSVAAINALEPEIKALSDDELKARFQALKEPIQAQLKDLDPTEPTFRESMRKALEPTIVPAFAIVREAGRRFLNMRHFDVQLIGGMVLHDGKIAEMKTGEGKTLVATLPAALNALAGRGVHIVTVNDFGFDYLRDNMKYDLAHCVQRDHHFAIVDEVDSILIDEARTPLIIS